MSHPLYIVYALLVAVTAIRILSDDGKTGRKIAWLFAIVFIPVIGLLVYVFLGINYRHKRHFDRLHRKFRKLFDEGSTPEIKNILFSKNGSEAIEEQFRPLATLLSEPLYPTPCGGNDIEVITFGKRKFDLLIEDIRKAEEYIHFQYYLFGGDKWSDIVKDELIKKAREGVKVRFFRENVSNMRVKEEYYDKMRKAGIEVVKFSDPKRHPVGFLTKISYRNHRKIVVIDGKVGYTGGMNIKDRYFEKWRDTHLRIEGPAINSLQYVFLDSWISAGGKIDRPLKEYFPLSFGSTGTWEKDLSSMSGLYPEHRMSGDPIILDKALPVLKDKILQVTPDEPDAPRAIIRMSFEWIFHNARKYVYIQMPYFMPPESTFEAMKSAALSGVDVRVMIPDIAENWFIGPTNDSFIEGCLDAGIRVFRKKGQFIHSKTLVCDDYLSVIGSSNIDERSFDINCEVNTYIYDRETALLSKDIFMQETEISDEVDPESWKKRPLSKKVSEKLLGLFIPIL